MNRLVQGDVGSAKTTVAAWGKRLAAQSGWQSADGATEVLAEQHYRTMNQLLSQPASGWPCSPAP